jgi:hypothetical protein
MQATTMETHDLHVSVFCANVSRLSVSHVVRAHGEGAEKLVELLNVEDCWLYTM